MNNPNNTQIEKLQRLSEIPALLEKPIKQRVRHRAEKRTVQRKIKTREAVILKELMELKEYQDCNNADERKALYLATQSADTNLEGLQERLEQIEVAIDNAEAEIELLKREQYSTLGIIEASLEKNLGEILNDAVLAGAVKNLRPATRHTA